MQDSERLVGLMERLLYLKTLPELADAAGSELASLADPLEERFFPPGAILFREGDLADCVHFIVEGGVELRGRGSARLAGAREVIGAPAVLELRPRFVTATAWTEVRTLALGSDDLLDVLEDQFALARLIIRNLARRIISLGGTEPPGEAHDPPFCPTCDEPLDLVQKVVFLKSVPFLAGATVDELVRLAGEVSETHAKPGALLFHAGQIPDALHLVLRGRVAAVGPRGIAGRLAMLGQTGHLYDGIVEQDAHLLRVPAEAFFDLLEDHFDLTTLVIRDLSRVARELEERAAAEPPAHRYS